MNVFLIAAGAAVVAAVPPLRTRAVAVGGSALSGAGHVAGALVGGVISVAGATLEGAADLADAAVHGPKNDDAKGPKSTKA